MSLLTAFFGNDRTKAEELAKDDELLRSSISRYFADHEKKRTLFEQLSTSSDISGVVSRLSATLADEVAMLVSGETSTKEIRSLLTWFSHRKRAITFERIMHLMNHASSQENYAFHLMKRLDSILRLQAYTLQTLLKKLEQGNGKQADALKRDLFDQFTEEKKVADELKNINLHGFYKNLALGARRKYEIEEHEKEIADGIFERMMETDTVEGIMEPMTHDGVARLTADCFNKIHDAVAQGIADGTLEHGRNADFEFVNGHHFQSMVYADARKLGLHDSVTRIFIIIFRDLYSSRIEQ